MLIRITRAVAVRGQHHEVGDVVEMDDLTARALVALRRAEAAPEDPAETAEAPAPEETAEAAPTAKKKKAA